MVGKWMVVYMLAAWAAGEAQKVEVGQWCTAALVSSNKDVTQSYYVDGTRKYILKHLVFDSESEQEAVFVVYVGSSEEAYRVKGKSLFAVPLSAPHSRIDFEIKSRFGVRTGHEPIVHFRVLVQQRVTLLHNRTLFGDSRIGQCVFESDLPYLSKDLVGVTFVFTEGFGSPSMQCASKRFPLYSLRENAYFGKYSMDFISKCSMNIDVSSASKYKIHFAVLPPIINLDQVQYVEDVVEKGETACYSSDRDYSQSGATIAIETEKANLDVLLTSGPGLPALPQFQRKYERNSLSVSPTGTKLLALSIPIPPAQPLQPPQATYICVMGDSPYRLRLTYFAAQSMEPGQTQKHYLTKDATVMLMYGKLAFAEPKLRLRVDVQEGCVQVLVLPRSSHNEAVRIYREFVLRRSAFKLEGEGEVKVEVMQKGVHVLQVPADPKDRVCGGDDVYEACPSYFVMRNCDHSSDSVAKVRLEAEGIAFAALHKPMAMLVPAGAEQRVILPSVAPRITRMQFAIEQISASTSDAFGTVKVMQNSKELISSVIKFGETIHDLPLLHGSEGPVHFVLSASETLNLKLSIRFFHNAQEIYNIKQGFKQETFRLSRINSTAAIGYFLFPLINPGEIKHDVLIAGNPKGVLLASSFRMDLEAWPKSAGKWNGEILRLRKSDPQYALNSFYYIAADGLAAYEEEYPEREAELAFAIYEESKTAVLGPGRNYSFGRSMSLKFVVSELSDFEFRKSGVSEEMVFISVDSGNPLPFVDHYDYIIESQVQEFDITDPVDYTRSISANDLEKLNPGCEPSRVVQGDCAIYVTVMCYKPKCAYAVSLTPSAESAGLKQKGDVQADAPKTDLQS